MPERFFCKYQSILKSTCVNDTQVPNGQCGGLNYNGMY